MLLEGKKVQALVSVCLSAFQHKVSHISLSHTDTHSRFGNATGPPSLGQCTSIRGKQVRLTLLKWPLIAFLVLDISPVFLRHHRPNNPKTSQLVANWWHLCCFLYLALVAGSSSTAYSCRSASRPRWRTVVHARSTQPS